MCWYNNLDSDKRFSLPKEIDEDRQYFKTLSFVLSQYVNKLEEINVRKEIIREVREINSLILDSIKLYYYGKIPKAQEQLKKIIDMLYKSNVIICDIEKSFGLHGFISYLNDDIEKKNNTSIFFYKARVSNSIIDFEPADMLHIPFDKRSLVKTQRFSIPGLPCMYFGTSSYVCWLELNKPMKSQFHVSSFEIDQRLKILNLISSWDMIRGLSQMTPWNFSLNKELIIKDLILLWPLVCATSFRVKSDNKRSFKSEYIVSQLLMQIILSMGIDGICYYSKKIKYDEFALPCCINMAIPAKYNGEEKISKICKSIKIRNPVNMEEFTMVKNKYLRNSNDLHGGVLLAKFIGPYDNTIFSDFDRYLKDQPYMKFDIKDINRSKVRN